jgi:homoserine dehydrogenase
MHFNPLKHFKMKRNHLTIGLFGFGCVGLGLYEVLEKTPGLKASIKLIGVKDKHKQRPIPSKNFTYNKADILDDPQINTVVELIDDADAAFEIVKAALQKGKAVVSANKKMLAEHFEELLALQKLHNVPLLYEAACCASIPIIRNLEEYYDNDLLESIEGIVNGSTNYMLTKLSKEDISYEQCLLEAQQQGFAESNPIMDTGGFDAKYKLLILIAHAFGLVLKPEDIFHLGIDKLDELAFDYAKEKGLKIKLFAFAEKRSNGCINAFVLPKLIKPEDKLFGVDDVFNGVKTKSYFSDVQFFVGKGAGAYPTASAVLSDISALSYDYRYEYKKQNQTDCLENPQDVILRVFLSHECPEAELFRPYFLEIEQSYQNAHAGYVIGKITFDQLQTIAQLTEVKTSLVLIDVI